MFTLTQNQGSLLWVSCGKLPIFLKLMKSEIERHKRFVIWIWNERVIADWIKVAQRAWQHSNFDFNSKSGLPTVIFLGQKHMFWRLGNQESNASNGSQFWVETREIWLIKARLRKRYAIMEMSMGQFVFGLLGSFFWGPLGFSFFTNPIFGCRAILVIWILSKF